MTTPDIRSTNWLKSNIAALGSAAVLTVYAAGWARTKAAADLLDEQSERRLPPRRPAARASVGQVEGTPVARTVEPTATPSSVAPATTAGAAVAPTVAAAPPKTVEPRGVDASPKAAPVTAPAATVVSAAPTSAAPTAAIPAPPTSSASAATSAPAPAPTTAASSTASSPAAPASAPTAPAQDPGIVPGAPRELATNAQATAPASKAPDSPNGPVTYKDGLFSGWGTSRHGDIEAYVEIRGGRIKSAFISECLTQYSCSWIAKLPPMVVEAQSAEIDYISGATHSSNAFYYAVVNALKKAQAR